MRKYHSVMNKRGWIKIVEAFVAILLIVGIVLSLLGGGYIKKEDPSANIYKIEVSILRDIQNNNSLRYDILNAPAPLPIEWNNFPLSIKNKIILDPPAYLNCGGKICSIEDSCLLSQNTNKDVFARSTIISSTITRQLKIFCWEK